MEDVSKQLVLLPSILLLGVDTVRVSRSMQLEAYSTAIMVVVVVVVSHVQKVMSS